MFLRETCLDAHSIALRKFSLNFSNCLAVDSTGRSGGIALLWSNGINLSVLSYSKNHIHAHIQNIGDSGDDWFFTGIYRHLTWQLIKSLNVPTDSAWLMCGTSMKFWTQEKMERKFTQSGTDAELQRYYVQL